MQPISTAAMRGWPLDALLYRSGPLSAWATDLLAGPTPGARVELAAELLADLGGRDDGPPEVVGVAVMPPDNLDLVPLHAGLILVGDRTASPGNLGAMIRSADALGADAVIVAGHAADPYDPRAVRASRGSLFALPVVRAESASAVLAWIRERPGHLSIIGTSEDGATRVWDHDWRLPSVLVVGNEAVGMSRAWTEACDAIVAIPQAGAASSLNAAVSASIVLYEVGRQRSLPPPAVGPTASDHHPTTRNAP